MTVAEVLAELGQMGFHVHPYPILQQNPLDGEEEAQIVNSRSYAVPGGVATQAGRPPIRTNCGPGHG